MNTYVEINPDTLKEEYIHMTTEFLDEAPNGLFLIGFDGEFARTEADPYVSPADITQAILNSLELPITVGDIVLQVSESRLKLLNFTASLSGDLVWVDVNNNVVFVPETEKNTFVQTVNSIVTDRIQRSSVQLQNWLRNGATPEDISKWLNEYK